MYMYRVAVHSLDAEFIFLNGDLECFFSRELKILCHFTHASIFANVSDELSSFHAGGELCLRLQFGTRSGFVTI